MSHRQSGGRHLLLPALLVAGAAAFFVGRTARPVGNRRVPQPAKNVDLQRYLGLWHELGRYDVGFEHDCEGVTAEYTLRGDGAIQVLNTCRTGAPDGPKRSARGKAKPVAGSGNAKLKVAFFGPFYVGNYWVMDHDDDYTWSIVGEPSGKYLWLLSRDPTPNEGFKAALFQRARELGYDTDMIRPTRQPPA
jgi:apolipoprotein D and lipocalin family protein